MIAAIEDRDAEVDHGITSQIAASRRLLHTLLDSRNELAGNRAAKDVIDKLETAASGKRLNAKLAVAELSVSSGLLLVPSMAGCVCANGLPVRNLRRFKCDLRVIPAPESRYDRLDVELSRASDEKLVGLRITIEAKQKILFHKLVQRRS